MNNAVTQNQLKAVAREAWRMHLTRALRQSKIGKFTATIKIAKHDADIDEILVQYLKGEEMDFTWIPVKKSWRY